MARKYNFFVGVNDIPLRYKFLLIYIFCVLTPILTINILFYSNVSKMTALKEESNLNISLERANKELKNIIDQSVAIGNTTSNDRALYEMMEKHYENLSQYYDTYNDYLRYKLDRYISLYPYISSITVMTENQTIENGGNYYKLDPEMKRSEWYQKVSATKETILVTAYNQANMQNSMEKKVFISVIRRLNSFADLSEYPLYLKVDLNIDKLLEIIHSEKTYLTLNLVDNLDRIVISSESQINKEASFIDVHSLLTDKHANLMQENLGAASYIQGWKLIGWPDQERLANEKRSSRNFFLILAAVSMVIPTLFIFIILHSYNYRVKKLSRHMELVNKERFELITLQEGRDEIGGLFRSFNTMVKKINSLINDVYKLELQRKELELERVRAELKYLQSQMDPHFLFNTLNAILVVCKKNNYILVTEIIKNLSLMLRRLLSWRDDLVTLEEEVTFTEMYLKIEKYRFGERFDYIVELDKEALKCHVPKMSIQSLVENSCKHGLQLVKHARNIRITVVCTNKRYLTITVEDNGLGMDFDTLSNIRASLHKPDDSGKNIGLQNVYRRLNLFYEDRATFTIESQLNVGTTVRFQIPIQQFSEPDQGSN
jgi:two-component system sensor histidine kinase YesM